MFTTTIKIVFGPMIRTVFRTMNKATIGT